MHVIKRLAVNRQNGQILIFVLVRRHVTFKLPTILETSNDSISGTGHPVMFVFDSMVVFLGPANRMHLFPVEKMQYGGLEISNDNFSEKASCFILDACCQQLLYWSVQ